MAARYDWETIRAEYEAGASQSELAKRHGAYLARPSRSTSLPKGGRRTYPARLTDLQRQKSQAWSQGATPKKRLRLLIARPMPRPLSSCAIKRNGEQHQQLIRAAVENGDFDAAKLAKITAETIKIRQEGERKAWGITDKGETDLSGGIAISWQK